jgi:hypothetical protein
VVAEPAQVLARREKVFDLGIGDRERRIAQAEVETAIALRR